MKVVFDKEQAVLKKKEHEAETSSRKARYRRFYDKYLYFPSMLIIASIILYSSITMYNDKNHSLLSSVFLLALVVWFGLLSIYPFVDMPWSRSSQAPAQIIYLNALENNSCSFRIKLFKQRFGSVEAALYFDDPKIKSQTLGTMQLVFCDDPERVEPVLDLNNEKLFISFWDHDE